MLALSMIVNTFVKLWFNRVRPVSELGTRLVYSLPSGPASIMSGKTKMKTKLMGRQSGDFLEL